MQFKVAIVQPPYPGTGPGCTAEAAKDFMLRQIEETQESPDLLVLPEYSNCPGVDTREQMTSLLARDSGEFLRRLSDLASRKRINIAANGILGQGSLCHNATVLIGREGTELARYCKVHLTHAESHELGLVPGSDVVTLDLEGVRLAFLTCFDVYFARISSCPSPGGESRTPFSREADVASVAKAADGGGDANDGTRASLP